MERTVFAPLAWAETEFGGSQLGDRRRQRRLVRMAAALVEHSHGSLPGSFSSWAELKAAYRLLEQPDVTYEQVIKPHCCRIQELCRHPGEYLLVEDTTSLDFTWHQAAQDLGRIGDDGGRGLWLHSTLALVIERWNDRQEPQVTVAGLFDQRWWARTGPPASRNEKKADRLRRERESDRWAAVTQQSEVPPDRTCWTYVADREADIWETFKRCQERGWQFIIRAGQPRALADQHGSVFSAAAAGPEWGWFSLDVRSRPDRPARRAHVAVWAATVLVRGPWRPGGWLEPCTITVVEARELAAPAGIEPIHWVLLTDWPCQSFQQARRVVAVYTRRWLIEEYHKALKTGTGIERSQLTTAGRITALLGILAVVAVHLVHMKLLAATCPDQMVTAEAAGPDMVAVLEALYGRPPHGWTNHTLLVTIAKLGGFPARKGDGNPGWITIWRGWQKLITLVHGYELANRKRCG